MTLVVNVPRTAVMSTYGDVWLDTPYRPSLSGRKINSQRGEYRVSAVLLNGNGPPFFAHVLSASLQSEKHTLSIAFPFLTHIHTHTQRFKRPAAWSSHRSGPRTTSKRCTPRSTGAWPAIPQDPSSRATSTSELVKLLSCCYLYRSPLLLLFLSILSKRRKKRRRRRGERGGRC